MPIASDENKLKLQLILPEQKRIEVMKFFHDMPTAGHLGDEKTLEKVKESFYNKVLYKYFSDSLAILVWYANCFCPFGERICNDQDETVYTFSERQGPQYVNCNSFHWFANQV
jgi:hypothetical protein